MKDHVHLPKSTYSGKAKHVHTQQRIAPQRKHKYKLQNAGKSKRGRVIRRKHTAQEIADFLKKRALYMQKFRQLRLTYKNDKKKLEQERIKLKIQVFPNK